MNYGILLIIIILIFINKLDLYEPMYDKSKYIVCYPVGGFCDMLNIINRCLDYAIKYNRILMIDTVNRTWFQHDIYKYITFTHKNIYNKLSRQLFNTASMYPPAFKNILNREFTIVDKTDYKNFKKYEVYTSLGNEINTDLSLEYKEDVLFYSGGGGGIPFTLIKYVHFNKIVLDEYYKRLNILPKKYTSFHIRNTDYKSDVKTFLEKHHNILTNNSCFIATDDITTRDEIKKKYGANIYYFSDIPKVENGGIHLNPIKIDHTTFIIECIVDILLLASANEYYYATAQSGYSKFALYLFTNKNILNSLVYR